MKKYAILTIAILYICVAYTQQRTDFIVAKVGREVILFSDLAKQINQIRSARMWNEELTPETILIDMIENKLIILKARELNIRVDERRIRNQAESQINHIRAQFEDSREYFRELRNAGLTPTDLRNYYEEMLTEQFLRERLIQSEIRSKINITDSELFEYYTENIDQIPFKDKSYEIAMIYRTAQPSAETVRDARNRINQIRDRLHRGEEFARLAREFSECPSARQGGDLGYFTRGVMVPEFEEVAFSKSINEISEVVRTAFGLHLIMVTDRTADEVKASHILIMINETEEDIQNERQLNQTLVQRIRDGEPFEQIVAEYSQDEDSKAANGVIGILSKDEFPEWFIEEIDALTVSECTEPLEQGNMFYIFKKNNEFPPRQQEFEEVKDTIRNITTQNKQAELYETWMENLKREIFVQIHTDRIAFEE